MLECWEIMNARANKLAQILVAILFKSKAFVVLMIHWETQIRNVVSFVGAPFIPHYTMKQIDQSRHWVRYWSEKKETAPAIVSNPWIMLTKEAPKATIDAHGIHTTWYFVAFWCQSSHSKSTSITRTLEQLEVCFTIAGSRQELLNSPFPSPK